MNGGDIKKHVEAVRRRMRDNNIGWLLLVRPANVTYTTGFEGSDSWAVVTLRDVYLLTDSRFSEQAQQQCPHCKIIQRNETLGKTAAKLADRSGSVRTITVDRSISLNDFETLKKNTSIRIVTSENIVESVRSIKDSYEIAAIRRAGRIANKALKQILKYLKPGVTENELAGILDLQIRRLGSINSFNTIVAFGANASRPHHRPGSRKLKKNDTVLIDFGARYKGYCCDITRCFAIGRPSALYKKVYEAVKNAQSAAIKMIKSGADICEIDAAARKTIAECGLPVYGHGTGHGIGLEVHELPSVASGGNRGKLESGNIVTIEPAVYMPGRLGVRIEDDILVTKNGCKILNV